MRTAAFIGACLVFFALAFRVTGAGPEYLELQPGVTLESGDTWSNNGERYRLYGVQSCLRGTTFTNSAGQKLDCGDASVAVFAAFIKDTHPKCAPVARADELNYVVCFANVGEKALDLAAILITEGYSFAALDGAGLPINPTYAVAEQGARERKAGLWQFSDVQHPSVLLSRAARERAKGEP
ncbi:thermonuclease family protein [Ensifer sp. YR511]|uniref:thermonuclease family protein n=1 Tax=Ensifer sp. YR511 TaxID=1855294 RepID=UPI00088CA4B8|nr:thermonuclease family protein [Ensifer sp. YR511]SDN95886.1 Endonuclease YncB, thermonuclease family [Ensifer sp. YR511]